MIVRREDIFPHPSGLRRPGPLTTAHHALARFYREAEGRRRRASWVERIAAAPSAFAVDRLLDDFRLFGSHHASAKVRAQVFETARVRKCELAGRLP